MQVIQDIQDIDASIQSEINQLLGKINKNNIPYNKKILVLSGGGTKGLVYYGAFKALDELGILENIHTFAVASAGAYIVSLYLMGYTVNEMEDFMYLFDFKKLSSVNSFEDISPNKLFINMGLDDGENIHKIINKLLKGKKLKENITLLELYQITKKKIIASTVCLNNGQTEYISYENYPNLRFSDLLRMTSAVPVFYAPVIINDKYYIDGGMSDNYPISIFDDNIEEVIGLYTITKTENTKINNFKDYLYIIFKSFCDSLVSKSIRGYEKYTILIDSKIENWLQFEITNKKKEDLFNIGYKNVINFFKSKKI
jgi:predicted acylesterase/phospholipase RssA